MSFSVKRRSTAPPLGADVPPALADRVVVGVRRPGAGGADHRADAVRPPGPRVAIPEMGQDVERRRLGPAVHRGDAAQEVLGVGLGVLDEDVEVAVGREGVPERVEQLELRLALVALAVDLDELVRTDTPPADTCRASSCRSGSASRRGRSSTPSRPRRGCPPGCSGRRTAPSGTGPSRSTGRAPGRCAGPRRRSRRCRPRSSGRRGCARGRAGSSSRRRRRRCSPRARCPRRARERYGPQRRQSPLPASTSSRRSCSAVPRILALSCDGDVRPGLTRGCSAEADTAPGHPGVFVRPGSAAARCARDSAPKLWNTSHRSARAKAADPGTHMITPASA